MKTSCSFFRMKPLALSFLFSLPCFFSHAANHVVVANQSIQSAIDGAASGDVIILTYPGEYTEHLAIAGKSLRLTSTNPDQTSVLGNLVISNLPANGKVTLDAFTLSGNINATGAGIVSLRNFTVAIGGGVIPNVETNGTSGLYLKSSTVEGTVTVHSKQDSLGNDAKLVVLQSDVREKLVSKAARSWIGYSTMEQTYFEGLVEIVGNDFNGRVQGGIGIDLNGAATNASIHNNKIAHFRDGGGNETNIGIRVDGGAKADVRNNTIHWNRYGSGTFTAMGVYVKSTTGTSIVANIMYNNNVSGGATTGHANVWAPAQNVVVKYNALNSTGGSSLVAGGADNLAFITNTDSNGQHFLTNPAGYMEGRAGEDKGPPEVIYNDHDGSRNDIGPNGGRNYLPNGRTTNKPIPISFTAAPLVVPVGGIITIQSTGAVPK